MNTDLLQKDMTELLGIEYLSQADQVDLMNTVGTIVVEVAVMRLVSSFNDDEQAAFEYFLDTEPTTEKLLTHLLEQYRDFEVYLQEEVIAYKAEAIKQLESLNAAA